MKCIAEIEGVQLTKRHKNTHAISFSNQQIRGRRDVDYKSNGTSNCAKREKQTGFFFFF